jgi:hypothetical protein
MEPGLIETIILCAVALCAVIALAGLVISRAIDRQTRELRRDPALGPD